MKKLKLIKNIWLAQALRAQSTNSSSFHEICWAPCALVNILITHPESLPWCQSLHLVWFFKLVCEYVFSSIKVWINWLWIRRFYSKDMDFWLTQCNIPTGRIHLELAQATPSLIPLNSWEAMPSQSCHGLLIWLLWPCPIHFCDTCTTSWIEVKPYQMGTPATQTYAYWKYQSLLFPK